MRRDEIWTERETSDCHHLDPPRARISMLILALPGSYSIPVVLGRPHWYLRPLGTKVLKPSNNNNNNNNNYNKH